MPCNNHQRRRRRWTVQQSGQKGLRINIIISSFVRTLAVSTDSCVSIHRRRCYCYCYCCYYFSQHIHTHRHDDVVVAFAVRSPFPPPTLITIRLLTRKTDFFLVCFSQCRHQCGYYIIFIVCVCFLSVCECTNVLTIKRSLVLYVCVWIRNLTAKSFVVSSDFRRRHRRRVCVVF